MFADLLGGFSALANPETFLYLVGGFLMGLVFGAIPGLTATLAIALLLPFTFAMELTNALVMVMAIFMSGIYAGSVTGITVNIPGAASGAITTMEGYALMKRGHGAKALSLDALASSIGGVLGAAVLMFVAVPMSEFALMFRTPDKFALVFMAVVTVVIVAKESIYKSMVAVSLGLMISTVGFDNMVAQGRFDFGSANLIEGVQLLPAVIGLFAICELLLQGGSKIRAAADTPAFKVRHRDFWPDWKDIREIGFWTYVKSSVIGVMIGMLPGGGASMASFVAYAEAKRVSKKPEEYGNGSHEGLAAAESANNAMCGGAVVPLLTLGIPGSGTTAILLGALIALNVSPGPRLMIDEPQIFWAVIMSMFIGNLVLLILNLPLIPYIAKILAIPRNFLIPFILFFTLMGAYIGQNNATELLILVGFGICATALKFADYPLAPLLIGFILGGMLEDNFARSMQLFDGISFIWERPMTMGLLFIALLLVLLPSFRALRMRSKGI